MSMPIRCCPLSVLADMHSRRLGDTLKQKTNEHGLCTACAHARLSGEANPNWNKDLTDVDRQSAKYGRGMQWQKLKAFILRREQRTCQISGQQGGKLAPHHLYGWGTHPERRFDPHNIILIAQRWHDLYHSMFGLGHTVHTYETFVLFHEVLTGEECPISDPYKGSTHC
jgi:hypothetical protein